MDLYHLVSKEEAVLRGLFKEEALKGEKHFYNTIGSVEVDLVAARFQDLNLDELDFGRRMIVTNHYVKSLGVNEPDLLKMQMDPTNEYSMKLAQAHARNYDNVLLSALLGTAYTGVDGTTTVAFDTSNQQIAHGSTGLTVAKINQAIKIMQKNHINLNRSDIYLLIEGEGELDLMSEQTFTSFDFMEKKTLAGRELPKWRGINIIRIEDSNMVHTAGSVNRALLVTGDALRVAIAQGMEVEIKDQPSKFKVHSVTASMNFGAGRVNEKEVVDILISVS